MLSYSARRLHAASLRDYGPLLRKVKTFGFHSSEQNSLRSFERVVLNCCKKGMSKRIIFRVEESLDPADGSIFFQDIAKYLQSSTSNVRKGSSSLSPLRKPKRSRKWLLFCLNQLFCLGDASFLKSVFSYIFISIESWFLFPSKVCQGLQS